MSFFKQITKPFTLFVIFFLTFGMSVVGKAAQKIKRSARRTKSTIKSSYANYLTARAMSYFRPAWDSAAKDPGLSDASEKLVEDPDDRIEKDFRVPSELKGRVRFWLDVYARYSSHYRIVHDREKPEIIYGYLDLRAIYRAFPGRIAHAKAQQMEKLALKTIKDRIAEAADISQPRVPTLGHVERESIRGFLAKYDASSPEAALALVRRMRTQTGQQDHFIAAIHRSERYLPEVEKIFEAKGLPRAVTRLPFVETSFNPKAVSKSGAMGMWQFMPDTAKLFDPRGTPQEWADPIRQSKSAARMLSILRERLPDWGIAVTAYNSGGGRLARLVKDHGVNDVSALVALPSSRETLGFAGKNFYCELLAANLVVTYKERVFTPRQLHLSRLRVPRQVQSLLEAMTVPSKPAEVPAAAPVTGPVPPVAPAAVAPEAPKAPTAAPKPVASKHKKKGKRSHSHVARARGKKKLVRHARKHRTSKIRAHHAKVSHAKKSHRSHRVGRAKSR